VRTVSEASLKTWHTVISGPPSWLWRAGQYHALFPDDIHTLIILSPHSHTHHTCLIVFWGFSCQKYAAYIKYVRKYCNLIVLTKQHTHCTKMTKHTQHIVFAFAITNPDAHSSTNVLNWVGQNRIYTHTFKLTTDLLVWKGYAGRAYTSSVSAMNIWWWAYTGNRYLVTGIWWQVFGDELTQAKGKRRPCKSSLYRFNFRKCLQGLQKEKGKTGAMQ